MVVIRYLICPYVVLILWQVPPPYKIAMVILGAALAISLAPHYRPSVDNPDIIPGGAVTPDTWLTKTNGGRIDNMFTVYHNGYDMRIELDKAPNNEAAVYTTIITYEPEMVWPPSPTGEAPTSEEFIFGMESAICDLDIQHSIWADDPAMGRDVSAYYWCSQMDPDMYDMDMADEQP